MKYHAIVIGDSFVNTLGFVRSLGQAHISVTLILVCDDDHVFVSKSRYINHLYQTSSLDEVLPIIQSCNAAGCKLLCTNDAAAQWVDSHEEQLSRLVYTPMRGNHLGSLFTKVEQCHLAQSFNIRTPQSTEYHRNNPTIISIPFPWLIRPIDSLLGTKSDIHICHNKKEFQQSIEQASDCSHYIVQQYIEKDAEYVLLGVSSALGVSIPVAVLKLRSYPHNYSPCCYGKIFTTEQLGIDTAPVCKMIKSTGYYGVFSIDMLRKDNVDYLLEINFRNDGTSYAATVAGANLPALLFSDNLPTSYSIKNISWMAPNIDYNHVATGYISRIQWLRDFLRARCLLNMSLLDPMPTAHYYLHKYFKHTSRNINP